MLLLRRVLISALAASAVSVALTVPVHTASAAGGPVTQVIVWGDSLTRVWPGYLDDRLEVPVLQMGGGAETVEQTKARFES